MPQLTSLGWLATSAASGKVASSAQLMAEGYAKASDLNARKALLQSDINANRLSAGVHELERQLLDCQQDKWMIIFDGQHRSEMCLLVATGVQQR